MTAEPAPAKLNLALHVTGRRADGYHLLDSLVAFAEVGDVVTLAEGPASLRVTGPFAVDVPEGPGNLCLRALTLAGAEAAVTLDKRLPVASGIGGGSADAAAVLRALARRGVAVPPGVAALGADVPVCLLSQPARMRGVGEVLDPVRLPPLAAVLVNPGVPLATPDVFRALARRDNGGLPEPLAWCDAEALLAWLAATRNDLEPPALRLAPVIGEVLAALRGAGAPLARLSGSGATCFGLWPTRAEAEAAAARLARPGWWVTATRIAPLGSGAAGA